MPKIGVSDFSGSVKGYLSDLAMKYERSKSARTPIEAYDTDGRDLSAYGFEKYRMTSEQDIFVRSVSTDDLFSDAEPEFEKVDTGLPAEDYYTQIAQEPENAIDMIEEDFQTEEIVTEATTIDDFGSSEPEDDSFGPKVFIHTIPAVEDDADEPKPVLSRFDDESEESLLSLFCNVERGPSLEVETHRGLYEEGVFKEVAYDYRQEESDFAADMEDALVEDSAIDDMEIINSGLSTGLMEIETPEEVEMLSPAPKAAAEIEMLRPAKSKVEAPAEIEMLKPVEQFTYVERAAPKLEDFASDEPVEETAFIAAAKTVAPAAEMTTIDSFVEEKAARAKAPVVIPEWDVTEAAAESFIDYASSMPAEGFAPEVIEIPAWDVSEETGAAFADYIESIPRESTWAKPLPEWDIQEETAEVFDAYMNIWPQYPKAAVIVPEWDASEDAAAAFDAYMTIRPEYPKAPVIVPEWDATEAAEAYVDYIASIPEESTWEVQPVWELSDEAVDAFNAYMTIRPEFPRRVSVIPEWDTAAENYADYISMIPRESTWAKPFPEWDATEATAEAFVDYIASIPEESTWEVQPVWEVTDDAVDAFNAYMTIRPEYPKAPVIVPEWDATEAAADGFRSYLDTVREEVAPVVPTVMAHTVSVSRIDIEPLDDHITDEEAKIHGMTANFAVTSSAAPAPAISVRNNTDLNQENMAAPARTARSGHFTFKNGKLMKVVEEVEIPEVKTEVATVMTTITGDAPAASETMEIEYIAVNTVGDESIRETLTVEDESTVPDVLALPAAQRVAALPAPRSAQIAAKNIEGVRFSFGRSNNGSGSIRFSF